MRRLVTSAVKVGEYAFTHAQLTLSTLNSLGSHGLPMPLNNRDDSAQTGPQAYLIDSPSLVDSRLYQSVIRLFSRVWGYTSVYRLLPFHHWMWRCRQEHQRPKVILRCVAEPGGLEKQASE